MHVCDDFWSDEYVVEFLNTRFCSGAFMAKYCIGVLSFLAKKQNNGDNVALISFDQLFRIA